MKKLVIAAVVLVGIGFLAKRFGPKCANVDWEKRQYFYKCQALASSNAALDDRAAERLWDVSAEMTGVS